MRGYGGVDVGCAGESELVEEGLAAVEGVWL